MPVIGKKNSRNNIRYAVSNDKSWVLKYMSFKKELKFTLFAWNVAYEERKKFKQKINETSLYPKVQQILRFGLSSVTSLLHVNSLR